VTLVWLVVTEMPVALTRPEPMLPNVPIVPLMFWPYTFVPLTTPPTLVDTSGAPSI
jgi:hypothetical protein